MAPLFTKLNLGAHAIVHVLNAPGSFEPELALLQEARVNRAVSGSVSFALAFVITHSERDAAGRQLTAASVGAAILWRVYPEGSRRSRCGFNRDSGWATLKRAGFGPVRMVADDEDWSALRFRRTTYGSRAAKK